MTRVRQGVVLAVVLGAASVAFAEETPVADVGAFPSPTVAPLMRIGYALGAVTLLGGGLTWWARRRSNGVAGGASAEIHVLARRGLGPKHHLALIDVGDRRLLLGLGGDSIRTLADLSEQQVFEAELLRELPEIHD